MKSAFAILPFLVSIYSYAQTNDIWNQIVKLPQKEIVDEARMECIYDHLTSDPILNSSYEVYDILLIGKQFSLYADYNEYRMDSTLNCRNKESMTNAEYMDIYMPFQPSSLSYIIRDRHTGSIEVHSHVFIDYYIYEETQTQLNYKWRLADDTLNVCGHLCHKATTTFRGRDWTIWYSEDIPESLGPWKFSGLPGLILMAEDSKREHVFKAVEIRRGNSPIKQTDHKDFKTNREWFNKALREYKMNPSGAMQGTGLMPKNLDGTDAIPPNHRRFFNPIERE